MQNELEVLAVSDMLVERALTEVVELLQLGSAVGGIGDVYLGVALNSGIVHVVVVLGIVKHLRQVVVVGHAHLHGVRIGLTEIGLCVVSQIESMLVPVERISCWRIFHTVDVALGVRFLLEEFPSTTCYLVGTWRHVRLTYTDERARQHNLWSLDVLDIRNTALEHDVDVHHMALADGRDVSTRAIALLVVVLVDDGDNLLL